MMYINKTRTKFIEVQYFLVSSYTIFAVHLDHLDPLVHHR